MKNDKKSSSWFPEGWGCFGLILLFEIPKIWYWFFSDSSTEFTSTLGTWGKLSIAGILGIGCLIGVIVSFSQRRYIHQPIIALLAIIAFDHFCCKLGPVSLNWTYCCFLPLVFNVLMLLGMLMVYAAYKYIQPQNMILKAVLQIAPMLVWAVILMILTKIWC